MKLITLGEEKELPKSMQIWAPFAPVCFSTIQEWAPLAHTKLVYEVHRLLELVVVPFEEDTTVQGTSVKPRNPLIIARRTFARVVERVPVATWNWLTYGNCQLLTSVGRDMSHLLVLNGHP
jgi:hypothetical protein